MDYRRDVKAVVSWFGDNTVRLWDVETGENSKTLEGHSGGVSSVYYSPDGKTVVSGSCDNTVRLWDMETGENTKTLEGHSGECPS